MSTRLCRDIRGKIFSGSVDVTNECVVVDSIYLVHSLESRTVFGVGFDCKSYGSIELNTRRKVTARAPQDPQRSPNSIPTNCVRALMVLCAQATYSGYSSSMQGRLFGKNRSDDSIDLC
jgi:hypothetical protein